MAIPAPSEKTKPLRSRSNGRLAFSGSSLFFERAPMFERLAIADGVRPPSVPPVMTTSASPRWIMCTASTNAWTPAAQAATEVTVGPWILNCIATWLDAMFGANSGIRNGLTRFGPLSRRTLTSCSIVGIPPPPVLTITPTRSVFSPVTSNFACSRASRVAATANCANRSMRRAALKSMKSFAWKSGTSPAMVTSRPDGSNPWILRMPERPSTSPDQSASRPIPRGLTAPTPVTTTRVTKRILSRRVEGSPRCAAPARAGAFRVLMTVRRHINLHSTGRCPICLCSRQAKVLQRERADRLVDAPIEAGEHRSGTDLDECHDAGADHGLDRCGPVHAANDMVPQLLADLFRRVQRLPRCIRDDRHVRMMEGDVVEQLVERRGRRVHQGGVGRDTDREPGDAPGSSILRHLHEPLHRLDGARDDGLTRAIQVGQGQHIALRCLVDQRGQLVIVHAEDRSHRARSLVAGVHHCLTAGADQPQAGRETDHAGGDERGELAERVS